YYLCDCALNLRCDLLGSRGAHAADSTGDSLFCYQDSRPEIIDDSEQPTANPEPASEEPSEPSTPKVAPIGIPGNVISTGAVGIKDLFNLAKNNLIEHTGAIPY